MPRDLARRPNLAHDLAGSEQRLRALKTRPTTRIVDVDADGLPWTIANPNWIDPTTLPTWSELRVSNTDSGSQIWRNLDNQWALAAS